MHSRLTCLLSTLLLSFSIHAAGNNPPYGSRLGSVTAFGGAGFTYSDELSGVHPNFGGGVDIGLHKHLGIFAEGGYSRLGNENSFECAPTCVYTPVKLTFTHVAGGLEVVGTNHSRMVPFAKVGMGYGRGTGSAVFSGVSISASTGTQDVAFGAGMRAYLRRHFGISAEVLGLHFVGDHGGGNTVVSTVGVFVQAR